jgi:hypothetical protein
MAAIRNETRGLGPLQVFDAVLIDDPAEQERLNRTLRRPDQNRNEAKLETDGAKGKTEKAKRSNRRSKRKKRG